MSVRLVLCLGASLAAFAAPQAVAEDFYAGKSISVLVGAGAGGSYDVYARTLATHMQRHIPGQPSIIVKIAGGVGGGVATAVQMEHSVPKDGLTLGIVQQTNVTSQITEDEVKGRYDVTKWHWIGNMAPLRNMLGVCVLRHGYETSLSAGHAAIFKPVARSVASPRCSARI